MLSDKLLINLKILSKIQKNGRIAKSHNGIISLEGTSFYQSVKRFVTNNSRKQAIYEINSIINEAVDTFNTLINSKYMNKHFNQSDEYIRGCEDLELVILEFTNAKRGIENLHFTYQNDHNISSQIDIVLLKMNITIKDVTNRLNYFRSYLTGSENSNEQEQLESFGERFEDGPLLENIV